MAQRMKVTVDNELCQQGQVSQNVVRLGLFHSESRMHNNSVDLVLVYLSE